MSWYKLAILKSAQIWKTDYNPNEIVPCLQALYELTYKYQTIQGYDFQGHPKRYNNILLGIENSAKQVINNIVDILEPVFLNWLENHAILSPTTWAKKRVDQAYEVDGNSASDLSQGMLHSMNFGRDYRSSLTMTDIIENMDQPVANGQTPCISKWFLTSKSELAEGDKEANRSNNENPDSDYTMKDEQVDTYYSEMTFSELCSMLYKDLESFLAALEQNYDLYEVCCEIYAYGLFPIWYGYWKQQGIDQTRANVENAYRMIKQVSNQSVSQALATINIIINTAHQTGSMTEYIAQQTGESSRDILYEMEHLSELHADSDEIKKWYSHVQGVGSKAPQWLPEHSIQDDREPLPQEPVQNQPVSNFRENNNQA